MAEQPGRTYKLLGPLAEARGQKITLQVYFFNLNFNDTSYLFCHFMTI